MLFSSSVAELESEWTGAKIVTKLTQFHGTVGKAGTISADLFAPEKVRLVRRTYHQ